MPKIEQSAGQLKAGVAISTTQVTQFELNTPAIEILIGGPYKAANGEMHNYGHAALRVITTSEERVYDFARYGATKGLFGAEGEGILRVWDKFDTYIAGENIYGRTTTGFTYTVTSDKALAVVRYFEIQTAKGKERTVKHPHQKEFKLLEDYDAVTNNCATTTLAGARVAVPEIDFDSARHNLGRGMTDVEKTAAKAHNFGWPSKIFMPADVQAMLENSKKNPARKVTRYKTGASK